MTRSRRQLETDALHALASRQLGLVTVAQLCAMGINRDRRIWLMRTGRFRRVRQGVYQMAGVGPSWDSTVLSAVLAAGELTVASHLTAGRLWDLFDGDPHLEEASHIDLIAVKGCRLHGVRMHRIPLRPSERAVRHRIPVTGIDRTLLDLTGVVDEATLGRCVDEALRRGLTRTPRLRAFVEAHAGPGRRRIAPLRAVLADRVGHAAGANPWEEAMDRRWDRLGLPPARRQFRVRAAGRTYILDRAITDAKVAVEWAGWDRHGRRSQFHEDTLRSSDLQQAGWLVIAVTHRWSDDRLVATVEAAVARQHGANVS
ncbi:MAG: hypothetical protein ACYC1D_05000 [Acidimicrobiales bacterium]